MLVNIRNGHNTSNNDQRSDSRVRGSGIETDNQTDTNIVYDRVIALSNDLEGANNGHIPCSGVGNYNRNKQNMSTGHTSRAIVLDAHKWTQRSHTFTLQFGFGFSLGGRNQWERH